MSDEPNPPHQTLRAKNGSIRKGMAPASSPASQVGWCLLEFAIATTTLSASKVRLPAITRNRSLARESASTRVFVRKGRSQSLA